jgi:hypothetical protein
MTWKEKPSPKPHIVRLLEPQVYLSNLVAGWRESLQGVSMVAGSLSGIQVYLSKHGCRESLQGLNRLQVGVSLQGVSVVAGIQVNLSKHGCRESL